jgi:hypothetical protein
MTEANNILEKKFKKNPVWDYNTTVEVCSLNACLVISVFVLHRDISEQRVIIIFLKKAT